jgi:hypothetical protein
MLTTTANQQAEQFLQNSKNSTFSFKMANFCLPDPPRSFIEASSPALSPLRLRGGYSDDDDDTGYEGDYERDDDQHDDDDEEFYERSDDRDDDDDDDEPN